MRARVARLEKGVAGVGKAMTRVEKRYDGSRVTWGMTAPEAGGKTVPPPVDNVKLSRTFIEYTEWCYRLGTYAR